MGVTLVQVLHGAGDGEEVEALVVQGVCKVEGGGWRGAAGRGELPCEKEAVDATGGRDLGALLDKPALKGLEGGYHGRVFLLAHTVTASSSRSTRRWSSLRSMALSPSDSAACAAPDSGVGVLHGLGEDEDALEHEASELGVGKIGGVGAQALEGAPEVVVVHPPVEGGPGYVGEAGALDHGGRGDQVGQSGELVAVEGSRLVFRKCLILSHSVSSSYGFSCRGGTPENENGTDPPGLSLRC